MLQITDIFGGKHRKDIRRYSYAHKTSDGPNANMQLEFDDGDHITVTADQYRRLRLQMALNAMGRVR